MLTVKLLLFALATLSVLCFGAAAALWARHYVAGLRRPLRRF